MHNFAGVTKRTASKQGGSRAATFAESGPAVSVITVCYNAAESLPATIASVAAQASQNYEFIIADGASTDGTVEILEKNDALIDRWVSAPDGGIYDAMNRGAVMARGRYLAFLNADDRYLHQTVERVIEAMEADGPDVIYGNMIKVRNLEGENFEREEKPNVDYMPQGMGIFHPAAFVKREAFEAAGGYDTAYRLAGDYALFLKLWAEGRSFKYIDAPLAYFSLGGASNAGCGTYEEAVHIQKKYRTGTAGKTRRQLWKCRFKKAVRSLAFSAAKITGTTAVLNRVVKRRWQ